VLLGVKCLTEDRSPARTLVRLLTYLHTDLQMTLTVLKCVTSVATVELVGVKVNWSAIEIYMWLQYSMYLRCKDLDKTDVFIWLS